VFAVSTGMPVRARRRSQSVVDLAARTRARSRRSARPPGRGGPGGGERRYGRSAVWLRWYQGLSAHGGWGMLTGTAACSGGAYRAAAAARWVRCPSRACAGLGSSGGAPASLVPAHLGHVPFERVRTGLRCGAAPVHLVHRIYGWVNSDHTHRTAISSEKNTTGPLIDDAASPAGLRKLCGGA